MVAEDSTRASFIRGRRETARGRTLLFPFPTPVGF
ncbi:hypothetical protein CDL12_05689 [Handroanthus impetiginosus]|uniref:Uncharacterized protein n=1 Tax=Handroanthus impetiginosus TaxID=429701 RepID=A0A2G9HW98_9LAMI|nr:hypothetical protein CDL12_05689 [Handroanthus impetiginosus]